MERNKGKYTELAGIRSNQDDDGNSSPIKCRQQTINLCISARLFVRVFVCMDDMMPNATERERAPPLSISDGQSNVTALFSLSLETRNQTLRVFAEANISDRVSHSTRVCAAIMHAQYERERKRATDDENGRKFAAICRAPGPRGSIKANLRHQKIGI